MTHPRRTAWSRALGLLESFRPVVAVKELRIEDALSWRRRTNAHGQAGVPKTASETDS